MINPNPSFSPALAAAIMPTTNFATKRADAAAGMQYEYLAGEMAKQAVETKQKALADVQQTMTAVDRANLLDPDKRRLQQTITEPIRQAAEDELLNQYGGDVVRWERERGLQLTSQITKRLLASPDYAQATQNMANYTLAQEAQKKGHMVVGNWDKNWQDFANDKTNKLDFGGSYEPPKDVFEHFEKNTDPDGYQYGRYVGKVNGRDQYAPIEVTQQHLINRLIGTGLTPQQAQDYAQKINYQGGRHWKMESQSPWDQTKQRTDLQHQRHSESFQQQGLSLQQQGLDETKRYHTATLAADAAKEEAKATAGGNATTTINREVYHFDPTTTPTLKTKGGQEIHANGKPIYVKPGVAGDTGKAIASAAGIDMDHPIMRRDPGGYPVSGPPYYASTLSSVRTTSGHLLQVKNGEPIQFKSIDTANRYHIYDTKGKGYQGYTPHVLGTVIVRAASDKEPEKTAQVWVPIPYNELTMSELANQGAFNTKEERAQRTMSPPGIGAAMRILNGESHEGYTVQDFLNEK